MTWSKPVHSPALQSPPENVDATPDVERMSFRKEPCSIKGFHILIAQRGGVELMRNKIRDEVIEELFACSGEVKK